MAYLNYSTTNTGDKFTLSLKDTGTGASSIILKYGTTTVNTCNSRVSLNAIGSTWINPQSVTSIAANKYRILFTNGAYMEYEVTAYDCGLKIMLTKTSHYNTPTMVGEVRMLDLAFGTPVSDRTQRDFPIARFAGGMVFAMLPATLTTKFSARWEGVGGSNYILPISPDIYTELSTYPLNKYRDEDAGVAVGNLNRNQGMFLILCHESEFFSKLLEAELILGLRTETLGGSLAKQHPMNYQNLMFVLDGPPDWDTATKRRATDDELIALCHRTGVKQVMFYARSWYDATDADNPFKPLPWAVNLIARLKEEGISSVAHSYWLYVPVIRGGNPDASGSGLDGWCATKFASGDVLYNADKDAYYMDIASTAYDEFCELYAQAILEAGFDGIYGDGEPGQGVTAQPYAERLFLTTVMNYFYSQDFYPKVVQTANGCPVFSYITKTGQTDIWEGQCVTWPTECTLVEISHPQYTLTRSSGSWITDGVNWDYDGVWDCDNIDPTKRNPFVVYSRDSATQLTVTFANTPEFTNNRPAVGTKRSKILSPPWVKLGSVSQFINGLHPERIYKTFITPELGWWGQVKHYVSKLYRPFTYTGSGPWTITITDVGDFREDYVGIAQFGLVPADTGVSGGTISNLNFNGTNTTFTISTTPVGKPAGIRGTMNTFYNAYGRNLTTAEWVAVKNKAISDRVPICYIFGYYDEDSVGVSPHVTAGGHMQDPNREANERSLLSAKWLPSGTIDFSTPVVENVLQVDERTLEIAFSEGMGSNASTNTNYTISGTGKDSLVSNPTYVNTVTTNKRRLIWDNNELALEKLQALKKLQIPHYSYGETYGDAGSFTYVAPADIDARKRELARICGSVSISHYWNNATVQTARDLAIDLKSTNGGVPLPIVINTSPQVLKSARTGNLNGTYYGSITSASIPVDLELTNEINRLVADFTSIAAVLAAGSEPVTVAAVLLDDEAFSGYASTLKPYRRQLYLAIKPIFPSATVEYYSYGAVTAAASTTGWDITGGTLFDNNNNSDYGAPLSDSWAISLYRPAEVYNQEEYYRRTNAARLAAIAGNITSALYTTPWISLGSGYQRLTDAYNTWGRWVYPITCDCYLGMTMNSRYGGIYTTNSRYAPWNYINHVIFYPTLTGSSSCDSVLKRFTAYCRGENYTYRDINGRGEGALTLEDLY